MRPLFLALLTLPITAHAFPKSTLTRGVLRIQNGEIAEGLADLESIRDHGDDADARPRDVAKLFAHLSWAHVRLATKGEGDPAHHLDVAFADWERCVAIDDPSARSMVSKCRKDALFAAAAAFNRAATIAMALEDDKPGASSAEARARCAQIDAYTPDSLSGATCHAVVARALRDPQAARAAAELAADRAAAMGELDSVQVARVEGALASAIQSLLYVAFDVDGAKALLARADALATPDIPMESIDRLRVTVGRFEGLAATRATARAGGEPEAWSDWLGTVLSLKLHEIAVADADAALVAFPDDARILELAGAAYQNAAAAREQGDDQRALRALLAKARAAFAHCIEVEPSHPRCAGHQATVEGYLHDLDPE